MSALSLRHPWLLSLLLTVAIGATAADVFLAPQLPAIPRALEGAILTLLWSTVAAVLFEYFRLKQELRRMFANAIAALDSGDPHALAEAADALESQQLTSIDPEPVVVLSRAVSSLSDIMTAIAARKWSAVFTLFTTDAIRIRKMIESVSDLSSETRLRIQQFVDTNWEASAVHARKGDLYPWGDATIWNAYLKPVVDGRCLTMSHALKQLCEASMRADQESDFTALACTVKAILVATIEDMLHGPRLTYDDTSQRKARLVIQGVESRLHIGWQTLPGYINAFLQKATACEYARIHLINNLHVLEYRFGNIMHPIGPAPMFDAIRILSTTEALEDEKYIVTHNAAICLWRSGQNTAPKEMIPCLAAIENMTNIPVADKLLTKALHDCSRGDLAACLRKLAKIVELSEPGRYTAHLQASFSVYLSTTGGRGVQEFEAAAQNLYSAEPEAAFLLDVFRPNTFRSPRRYPVFYESLRMQPRN